ncbi:MAG: ice-binding family protein [Ignavibacteriaceae bacterium]|jgi:hypothetical protein|nr:ice-binding family protein [Ignavibacteriaceae bacterium]
MKTNTFLLCVLKQRLHFIGAMLIVALMMPAVAFSQPSLRKINYTNPTAIPLGRAGTFGALAYSGIPSAGTYTVNGDVGSSTGSISTNISAGAGGTKYVVGDQHALDAQTDLGTALNEALNNRAPDVTDATGAISGTLTPGIYRYTGASVGVTGNLILDGGAVSNPVFIIKTDAILLINSNATVTLAGTAVWSNVFWYVGSSATIYDGTTFNGIVLAEVSITLNASATSVTAKLLAHTGAVTVNSTVLPVELTSFSVALNNNAIELNWKTATEVNNYGFEVQRSETQNYNWAKIGFVNGAGNSNSPKSYSFVDKTVSYGSYAYRLKQLDNNGEHTYSDVIEVNAAEQIPNGFLLNQNYPNPFNPSTQIQFGVSKNTYATLTVFNVLGVKVSTLFNGNAVTGHVYNLTFNGDNLASGIYYYKLQTNEKKEVRKMILMR